MQQPKPKSLAEVHKSSVKRRLHKQAVAKAAEAVKKSHRSKAVRVNHPTPTKTQHPHQPQAALASGYETDDEDVDIPDAEGDTDTEPEDNDEPDNHKSQTVDAVNRSPEFTQGASARFQTQTSLSSTTNTPSIDALIGDMSTMAFASTSTAGSASTSASGPSSAKGKSVAYRTGSPNPVASTSTSSSAFSAMDKGKGKAKANCEPATNEDDNMVGADQPFSTEAAQADVSDASTLTDIETDSGSESKSNSQPATAQDKGKAREVFPPLSPQRTSSLLRPGHTQESSHASSGASSSQNTDHPEPASWGHIRRPYSGRTHSDHDAADGDMHQDQEEGQCSEDEDSEDDMEEVEIVPASVEEVNNFLDTNFPDTRLRSDSGNPTSSSGTSSHTDGQCRKPIEIKAVPGKPVMQTWGQLDAIVSSMEKTGLGSSSTGGSSSRSGGAMGMFAVPDSPSRVPPSQVSNYSALAGALGDSSPFRQPTNPIIASASTSSSYNPTLPPKPTPPSNGASHTSSTSPDRNHAWLFLPPTYKPAGSPPDPRTPPRPLWNIPTAPRAPVRMQTRSQSLLSRMSDPSPSTPAPARLAPASTTSQYSPSSYLAQARAKMATEMNTSTTPTTTPPSSYLAQARAKMANETKTSTTPTTTPPAARAVVAPGPPRLAPSLLAKTGVGSGTGYPASAFKPGCPSHSTTTSTPAPASPESKVFEPQSAPQPLPSFLSRLESTNGNAFSQGQQPQNLPNTTTPVQPPSNPFAPSAQAASNQGFSPFDIRNAAVPIPLQRLEIIGEDVDVSMPSTSRGPSPMPVSPSESAPQLPAFEHVQVPMSTNEDDAMDIDDVVMTILDDMSMDWCPTGPGIVVSLPPESLSSSAANLTPAAMPVFHSSPSTSPPSSFTFSFSPPNPSPSTPEPSARPNLWQPGAPTPYSFSSAFVETHGLPQAPAQSQNDVLTALQVLSQLPSDQVLQACSHLLQLPPDQLIQMGQMVQAHSPQTRTQPLAQEYNSYSMPSHDETRPAPVNEAPQVDSTYVGKVEPIEEQSAFWDSVLNRSNKSSKSSSPSSSSSSLSRSSRDKPNVFEELSKQFQGRKPESGRISTGSGPSSNSSSSLGKRSRSSPSKESASSTFLPPGALYDSICNAEFPYHLKSSSAVHTRANSPSKALRAIPCRPRPRFPRRHLPGDSLSHDTDSKWSVKPFRHCNVYSALSDTLATVCSGITTGGAPIVDMVLACSRKRVKF
ncbi:hypothetical protein VKT23_007309 [Stygiomarasmius scandens]|uniref:Uncharacterized protein n=1 Tax=Marasmiellus scandens TaxID=2682957 RepID=A0ABR1JPY6_9AGAR